MPSKRASFCLIGLFAVLIVTGCNKKPRDKSVDPAVNRAEKDPAESVPDDPAVRKWIDQLGSQDPSMREDAARQLAALGPKAKKAIPALQKALHDQHLVSMQAAIALAEMAPEVKEVMPVLIAALSDRQGFVAPIAARGLTRFGKAAVPSLIKALPERYAAEILGEIGPDAADAVPALLRIVTGEGPNFDDKDEAARAIGRIGPASKETILALTQALKAQKSDPAARNGNFRLQLAIAILQLDPQNAYALERLNECLTDMSTHVSIGAAYELGRRNPGDPKAVRRLTDLYPKVNGIERPEIVDCLGKLGPVAKEAFPMLSDALINGVTMAPDRANLPGALARIDPQTAVPVILKYLNEKDFSMRLAVVEALGEAGLHAKAAVPKLRAMSESDDIQNIRDAALQALQKIEKSK